MGLFSKKEKFYTGSVGGIPFFFSILCLAIFDLSSAFKLLQILDPGTWSSLALFAAAAVCGAWLTYVLISGRISVLIHEFKHSFVSGLVGNKARKLKVTSGETGHFEYSFTKDTAKFNALISLAPYFFPLFSAPIFILWAILTIKQIEFSPAILGLAFGADMLLNMRDIGWHQTDFTKITGGYFVGLAFVALMNIAILLIYLAWIGFQLNGLLALAYGLGEFLLVFVKKDIEPL